MHRSLVGFLLILSFLIMPLSLLAQTPTVTPTVTAAVLAYKPIDVHFTTVDGLTYAYGDDALKTYQDFHDVMDPLKDFETQRLINCSQSSDDTSKLFKMFGLIGAVVGVAGIATVPANQQTPFIITALGGGVLFDVGTIFASESQTAKFNSVQRYNRFAYGREQVLPQTPADEKSLLPMTAPGSTVTPETKGKTNGAQ